VFCKRFNALNGFVALSLSLTGMPVLAMENSPIHEMAFAGESGFLAAMPVVLTATRISQPVTETPASMTIIDRDMIRASGFRELVDVLRLVPGFQVAHGSGNYFVPTYHGLVDDFPRRMLVQVDGRSVYLPMLSSVDWNYLGVALDDIERIEVVRGSNNSVNGSNAFLGVINIVTRQPFQDPGTTVEVVSGSLYAGNVRQGLRNQSADQTWRALDAREIFVRQGIFVRNWDMRVSASYREDQGFSGVHDSKYIRNVFTRAVGDLGNHSQLDVQLGVSEGRTGVGYENDPMDIGNPVRDVSTRMNYQSLAWSRALTGGDELTVHAYHNYYYQNDTHIYGKLSQALSHELGTPMTSADVDIIFPGITDKNMIVGYLDGEAERYDVEAQRLLRASQAYELVLGAGVRQDSYRSQLMLTSDKTIYDLSVRLFANVNLHVGDSMHVNVGNMVEHNDIVGAFYSSRLGMNYSLTDTRAVRMSFSHSERSPSLLEANVLHSIVLEDGQVITVNRVAADDARTEKLGTIEVGFVEKFERLNTTLDVKLFREQLRDAIFDATDHGYADRPVIVDSGALNNNSPSGVADAPVDNFPFVYLNGVDANLNGVEVQLQYRPQRHTFVGLQYSYIDPEATQLRFINYQGVTAKNKFRDVSNGVPYHTSSLLASYQFRNKWELSGGVYRITEMRWFGDGDLLPAYRRIDARLGKTFKIDNLKARVALVVQNLEKDYEEFRVENKFGQHAYLQGNFSF